MNARTPRRPRTPPRSTFATSTSSTATGTWRWLLTTAARATCRRDIERTGYADFWELYKRNVLPRETKNYVPIIIALTLIAKDAAHYIFRSNRKRRSRRGRETGRANRSAAGGGNHRRRRGDASLAQSLFAAPGDSRRSFFRTASAAGHGAKFSAEIANPPDKWVSWRRHRVKPERRLMRLSPRTYRVRPRPSPTRTVVERNTALDAGEKLIIPRRSRNQKRFPERWFAASHAINSHSRRFVSDCGCVAGHDQLLACIRERVLRSRLFAVGEMAAAVTTAISWR